MQVADRGGTGEGGRMRSDPGADHVAHDRMSAARCGKQLAGLKRSLAIVEYCHGVLRSERLAVTLASGELELLRAWLDLRRHRCDARGDLAAYTTTPIDDECPLPHVIHTYRSHVWTRAATKAYWIYQLSWYRKHPRHPNSCTEFHRRLLAESSLTSIEAVATRIASE